MRSPHPYHSKMCGICTDLVLEGGGVVDWCDTRICDRCLDEHYCEAHGDYCEYPEDCMDEFVDDNLQGIREEYFE